MTAPSLAIVVVLEGATAGSTAKSTVATPILMAAAIRDTGAVSTTAPRNTGASAKASTRGSASITARASILGNASTIAAARTTVMVNAIEVLEGLIALWVY